MSRSRSSQTELIVLPEEERDGIGIYDDQQLTLVKRLKNEGFDVAFEHDAEHRVFRGRNGFTPNEATFLLNIDSAWVS